MDFSPIYNHHESEVIAEVAASADKFPEFSNEPDLLMDVACVALNRLPPRYIRHAVDYSFYLTEQERREVENSIKDAVAFAYAFVGARQSMKAER
ncbi:late competence development ComFB family protein [Roseateles sp. BYS180W]|uniref:Late competence development ComFB family protein n=1 Tax=Roseateles rivi TaxID=3299028 RepID=A0ABW7FYA3_9BURK